MTEDIFKEAIVVPQIIIEDGKKYEVYNEPGVFLEYVLESSKKLY